MDTCILETLAGVTWQSNAVTFMYCYSILPSRMEAGSACYDHFLNKTTQTGEPLGYKGSSLKAGVISFLWTAPVASSSLAQVFGSCLRDADHAFTVVIMNISILLQFRSWPGTTLRRKSKCITTRLAELCMPCITTGQPA